MKKNFILQKRALLYPILMLFAMWLGFLLQHFGWFQNCSGAIIPLAPDGLKGILLSPFLHGNLEHIFGNSIPIAVLMFLLYQFYPHIANKIFFTGWLTTGLLVWLLPPIDIATGDFYYTCIIGASGIVYVLAFFLFFSGVFRRDGKLLAVTLVVGLYYGGLVWGVFPEEFFYTLEERSRISWQSHLAGALVGIILAFMFRKIGEKKKRFIWEFPNYYSEKDDKLWQEYKENHPNDFLDLPSKKTDNVWKRLEELRREE
ncbi:MAG: rhomboid family intramembrane serine protease [Cruoricaptor ignavus]|nr:rhomboid family intramembrane serine protease [Cruoricaptor ignavus]